MDDTHYINACKIGPSNCDMGEARIKFTDTIVQFLQMNRPFWVDTGCYGKSYGSPGDYLILLHGVRRIVSKAHFELNYIPLEG
jgi:hypothetical protein